MFSARAKVVLYLLQLLAFKVSYSVLGLESVHVKVPIAVLVGSSVTLVCECDLPDEDLYSVKWYKGKHEFFRYTSKEIPSIKIFPKAGINVGVNLSNASHLVLAGVEPQSSGRYSCEITEAAPSFHTQIATRTMNVVDPPATDPTIVDMKPYYGADEFLEVSCTTSPSLPAARLEWLINDQPLPQPLVVPSRLEFLTLPAAATDGGAKAKPSSKKTQLDKSSQQLQQQQEQLQPHQEPWTAGPSPNRTEELSSASRSTRSVPYNTLPVVSNTSTITGGTSGPTSEHRKPGGSGRYETSVARLKLLLDHSHFPGGKLKVECIAHIFDLYSRSAVAYADENYPQVRVLSNSDNGVHFSFMSDKDDAPTSSAGRPTATLALLDRTSYFIRLIGTWLPGPAVLGCWAAPRRLAPIADTGQPSDGASGCILLAGLVTFFGARWVAGGGT